MANIDKIIEEILTEAKEAAKQNISKAESEAEKILAAAKEDCKKTSDAQKAGFTQGEKVASERAKSAAAQQKRQAILKAKQELIAQLLEKAYDSILFMPDNSYFDFIEHLLSKYCLEKDGVIYFSQKDLDRFPTGFETKIADIAAKKNGSLNISKEARAIDGGFILSYGGIEENCSLKAVFHAENEMLNDKVHEFLFS